MSASRNCPACGQTINSVNDAIFCTRRTPCLVATHYGTMCNEPARFANEEDRVVGLMNRVHGYAVQALHAAEKAVGIRHDPPPPAAEIQPQVPPAVEADGGGSLQQQGDPAESSNLSAGDSVDVILKPRGPGMTTITAEQARKK